MLIKFPLPQLLPDPPCFPTHPTPFSLSHSQNIKNKVTKQTEDQ